MSLAYVCEGGERKATTVIKIITQKCVMEQDLRLACFTTHFSVMTCVAFITCFLI
jgi:hypothetical protein